MLLFSELPCWFSTACGTFAWRKILVVIQTNFGLRMPDSNTFPLFCFLLINSWSSKSLRFQLPNILRHLEVFTLKKIKSRICAEPSTLTPHSLFPNEPPTTGPLFLQLNRHATGFVGGIFCKRWFLSQERDSTMISSNSASKRLRHGLSSLTWRACWVAALSYEVGAG